MTILFTVMMSFVCLVCWFVCAVAVLTGCCKERTRRVSAVGRASGRAQVRRTGAVAEARPAPRIHSLGPAPAHLPRARGAAQADATLRRVTPPTAAADTSTCAKPASSTSSPAASGAGRGSSWRGGVGEAPLASRDNGWLHCHWLLLAPCVVHSRL